MMKFGRLTMIERRRIVKPLAVLILLTLVCGCGTSRGVEEFGVYTEAFQQSRNASEVILDRVAVAERKLWRQCTNFQTIEKSDDCILFDSEEYSFSVSHARYVTDAGNPPITNALRRALVAVGVYTNALNGLAAGQTAEAMAGQVGQLVGIAAAASSAIVPIGGAGPLGPVSALASNVNDDIASFNMPITQALGFITRAKFRAELLEGQELINRSLDSVLNATPLLFEMLRAEAIIGARSDAEIETAAKAARENLRLIANWVLMLETSREALRAAIDASKGEGAGASGLIASAAALTEAAQETRKALAGDGE